MTGGKGPRRKGTKFERDLVNHFQDEGIAAERNPLSGASPFGSFSGFDMTIPLFGTDYRVECKHMGQGFKTLYGWLEHGHNDFLIVRADHQKALAVIPLEILIKWEKERGKKKK